MRKDVFNRHNEIRKARGVELFRNPRNAAGVAQTVEPGGYGGAETGFLCIFDRQPRRPWFEKAVEALLFLQDWVLLSPGVSQIRDLEEILAYLDGWKDGRHNLNYKTDGVVIKWMISKCRKQSAIP